MRAFATTLAIGSGASRPFIPLAMVALCCVLLGCSSHHDAMTNGVKDGAKDGGDSRPGAGGAGSGSAGMNVAGTSGEPRDAGASPAPPGVANDASAMADAMTATMRDAGEPVDAAATLSACAKRPGVCEPGQVPQAKTAIGEAFRSCALAMTVMPCGAAVVTFDAEGCADAIVVKIAGTPNDAIAKCVADKLADRRFQCAAAMDITFSASCT